MKQTILALGAVFALPLCAANLVINTPVAGPLTDSQDLSLASAATVAERATVVISATMKFSLPSTQPTYATAVSSADKLVLVADRDGELLLANGATGDWLLTGLWVTETDEVQVLAVGTKTETGLSFTVTLTKGETSVTKTVTSPSSANTIQTLAFEGEGTATAVQLAMVSTDILPSGTDTPQDASLVSKYAEWINGKGKGFAGKDAKEQKPAFAMNVPGAPKLEITKIDTVNRKIEVAGSYGDDATPADLADIHGKLYITSAAELDGTPTTTAVDLTVVKDKVATIPIPDGAKFIRARVALTPPENKL